MTLRDRLAERRASVDPVVPAREWLSVAEVCELTGLSKMTVRRILQEGRGVGCRKVWYSGPDAGQKWRWQVHVTSVDVIRSRRDRRLLCHLEESTSEFGKTVRALRLRMGYSGRMVASLAHVSPTWWSAFELGRRRPGLVTVARIAKALQCTDRERLQLFDLAAEAEATGNKRYQGEAE